MPFFSFVLLALKLECASQSLGGPDKTQIAGPTLGMSHLIGLGGAGECAFLTSFQVTLFRLVWGPYF